MKKSIGILLLSILLVRQGELIQQGEPRHLLQNLSGMVWNSKPELGRAKKAQPTLEDVYLYYEK